MAELVDAPDSKSGVLWNVRVRLPPCALVLQEVSDDLKPGVLVVAVFAERDPVEAYTVEFRELRCTVKG